MSEVTWFKVLTDIFSDDKIKIIQSMPEGDSLLVMWFKVLSQAGKTNDGGYIYLKKNIPYTAGMLSTLFGKQQQLVEMAMRTFTEFGMIDVDENGYIFVNNWERHQSIDKLNQIKEKTKLRVQNHREKKKLELQESNATVTLQVTQSNAIELEVDKEIIYIVPDDKIIFDYWNSKGIIRHREFTHAMKSKINARLVNRTADEIIDAINNYQTVITSDLYFFSYKWSLLDFMNPDNLEKFVSENNPFQNYIKSKSSGKKNEKPTPIQPELIVISDEERDFLDRVNQQQTERNKRGATLRGVVGDIFSTS